MKTDSSKKMLPPEERAKLLEVLRTRFEQHRNRHAGVEWAKVKARLEANPEKLWSLHAMESTGGEPDVVRYDNKTGECVFFDCSEQSPAGRTSLCYDREALDARKKFKPKNCALDLAASMGVEVLTEQQYAELQQLGDFDTKSSTWLKTPEEVRRLGGAIFGDRRFGRVFIYHNGADSYYAGRGFRAWLKV